MRSRNPSPASGGNQNNNNNNSSNNSNSNRNDFGAFSVPPSFHPRCGQLVSVHENGKTATRTHAAQEFNHGLVMSNTPLVDNQMFEVRIDKKVNSWSGSIEIGVTACDPNSLDAPLPSSATELRKGSWIMSGNSVLRDGRSIHENYGAVDLDKLEEADRVGVLRTTHGDLVFFVNGVSQSVAASGLPETVWAVVDLYGKCAQVTLMTDNSVQETRLLENDLTNEATAAAAANNHVNQISSGNRAQNNLTNSNIAAMSSQSEALQASLLPNSSQEGSGAFCPNNNKLRFHERKGALVKLSNNNRTAERRRPFDEFNNGVVITHRPLQDNELFEMRIDRLVDKWSGSIEVGITTHNPGTLEFPATMTNQRSGTMMMSGCGILTNGKGTRREYGEFNLDELSEGDRIGMIRKGNGNLHFYINGLDQGVAATRVPNQMWGVVDLYGMTVKVTIVDRDERDEQNLITRRNVAMREPFIEENRLLFHGNCGSHAAVINSGLTAHRPNANDDFNFGVVLTSRPLKTNEVFEVRLDKMVSKWAGSIEIGVTTHNPDTLEFPSTMTNIRSGTWMMTGNGVMHNGTTVIDDYGQNLDKLKVGGRVAVVRKENGTIHFFVNSEDQGPAATNVPERVYGVIDLYGQAVQATIIDLAEYRRSPDGAESDVASATPYSLAGILESNDLKFHHLHGRNARISNNGLTASRPNALGEFNDGIVMSNRPLRDGELFEIVIEKMVERWSGSIEAGVTLIRPEDLEFPNTMTDLDYDTWMLSGNAVMQDGQTIRNGYCCDLDSLSVGSRLGMMRHFDGSLHYMINGEDQGIAVEVPPNVYAVVDLYGQVSQVSVIHHLLSAAGGGTNLVTAHQRLIHENNCSLASSQVLESSHISLPMMGAEVVHRFNPIWCSKSVEIKNNNSSIVRKAGGRFSSGSALAFASTALWASPAQDSDDYFEIRIDDLNPRMAGSLKFGVATSPPIDMTMTSHPGDMIWLEGHRIKHNGKVLRTNYALTSTDRLDRGDKLTVKRLADGSLRFLVNGEDCGASVPQVPRKLYPFVGLQGSVSAVSISSVSQQQLGVNSPIMPQQHRLPSMNQMQDSLEVVLENCEEEPTKPAPPQASVSVGALEFHDNHGRNIQLKNGNLTAVRTDSYNQGLVVTHRPLNRDELFEVTIERLSNRWTSSVMIGILLENHPDKIHLPITALGFKKNAIVLAADTIFQNGQKLNSIGPYGPNLETLTAGHKVGVKIDDQQNLRFFVDGVDQGAVQKVQTPCYGLVDLYGQCEEVSITNDNQVLPTEDRPEQQQQQEVPDQVQVLEKSAATTTTAPPPPISYLLCGGYDQAKCEFFILCKQFKSSLSIPSYFFTSSAVCYCQNCVKLRGDELYVTKGDPAKDFSTPINWVRFPMRLSNTNNSTSSSSTESWHTAYHGTAPSYIRKILDRGELVPLDILGLGHQAQGKSKESKHDESAERSQLAFSPTIKYMTSLSKACPQVSYQPKKKQNRMVRVRVAFQVDIHPGSYKIGAPVDYKESQGKIDAHFKLDETEWLTKERGNTAVKALLVNLET